MSATKTIDQEHAEACGALCHEDFETGLCSGCLVSMCECDECHGIGYHKPDCVEMQDGVS